MSPYIDHNFCKHDEQQNQIGIARENHQPCPQKAGSGSTLFIQ
jgi:hypothetical protein